MIEEPSVEIVIPAYNEADNLPTLIEELNVIRTTRKFDVIIVNNGSSDNSSLILNEYSKKYYWLSVCQINQNKGYGHGILSGLSQTKADLIGWTHADLQFDPYTLIQAIELAVRNQTVIIKGKRTGRKFFEKVITFGMSLSAMCVLGLPFYDINAQPKLFSRKYFNEHFKNVAPEDFSFDLFFMFYAVKKGVKIIEFEVEFRPRLAGEAKGGGASTITVLKIVLRTISYMWKIRNDHLST